MLDRIVDVNFVVPLVPANLSLFRPGVVIQKRWTLGVRQEIRLGDSELKNVVVLGGLDQFCQPQRVRTAVDRTGLKDGPRSST